MTSNETGTVEVSSYLNRDAEVNTRFRTLRERMTAFCLAYDDCLDEFERSEAGSAWEAELLGRVKDFNDAIECLSSAEWDVWRAFHNGSY